MKHTIRDLMDKKESECCICGKKFSGHGNNPWPVEDSGKCCDECNMDVVIPARMAGVHKIKPKDSVADLNRLIASENEAVDLYTTAINNAGDGIEKQIYTEILNDEKEHLVKLKTLLDGYTKANAVK